MQAGPLILLVIPIVYEVIVNEPSKSIFNTKECLFMKFQHYRDQMLMIFVNDTFLCR